MGADVTVAARVGAMLGEGPAWIAADRALWFVDIKGLLIYRFDPADGALRHWTAPDHPGWILPTRDGGYVGGLKTGLHRFDPEGGRFVLVHHLEAAWPSNRLNDAATDRTGRLWFGTMDDGEQTTPAGCIAMLGLYAATAGWRQ